VRLEELGQLKNPVTSSRIEPVTFWLPQPTTLPSSPTTTTTTTKYNSFKNNLSSFSKHGPKFNLFIVNNVRNDG
jgi:hypothetical protein